MQRRQLQRILMVFLPKKAQPFVVKSQKMYIASNTGNLEITKKYIAAEVNKIV